MAKSSPSRPMLLLAVLCSLLLVENATAQVQHGVNITFPTPGITVYFGDTVNVSWTSPFEHPKLFTFCMNKTDNQDVIQKDVVDVPPFNASYLAVINFVDYSDCYFNLRPNMSAGYGANSYHIKVLTGEKSKTTIGLPLNTSPSTPVPSSPENAAATKTGAKNGNSNSGMSTGAKAGIGAGIAGGVVAVAAIAALLLMRRKHRKDQANNLSEPKNTYTDSPGVMQFAPHDGNGQAYTPVSGNVEYQAALASDPPKGHMMAPPTANELPVYSQAPSNTQVYEMGGDSRPAEVMGSPSHIR